MIIKFLDTKTGETAWSDYPFSVWWWSEGNGACDCNRAILFGHDDICGDSPYRYQAVAIGVHIDKSIDQQLIEVNEDIVEKSKLRTEEDILKAVNEGLY